MDNVNQKVLDQVSSFLIKDSEYRKVSFTLSGQEVKPHEVFNEDGLLGFFILDATQNYKKIFDREPKVAFFEKEEAILGVLPAIEEDGENTFSLWSHLLDYSLERLIKKELINNPKANTIPVDSLAVQWQVTPKKLINNPLKFA